MKLKADRILPWPIWLAALAGGYALTRRRLSQARQRNITLVAHRGGALEAPETTAAAYNNALSLGFNALELDIQMTKDGELVAFHDDTVDRTTDGAGPVADKTLAEIKALDAGSWFGAKWAGEKVLTFREVIDIAKTGPDGGARLLVELKSPRLYPGIEQQMIDTLEDTGYMDKVMVMSFDGASLEKVRELRPQLPLCFLLSPTEHTPEVAARAEVIGPLWQVPALNPLWIPIAHRDGHRVSVWTVNSELAMLALSLFGVDMITTDRPSVLVKTFGLPRPGDALSQLLSKGADHK